MFSSNTSQVADDQLFVESVFSTYLYTGNGSTQTINNGIDLSGKGGLVWIKGRSGATDHALYDTARGATFDLVSNTTAAQTTQSTGLTAFNASGFNIGALAKVNTSAATYTSWTFRKAAKFFDFTTFTLSGTDPNKRIPQSLGSVPGFIVIKRTDAAGAWYSYHQSLGRTKYLMLNSTNAVATNAVDPYWGTADPTATDFGINENQFAAGTYVAYLCAHNAGGFGLSGTDNVISCGSVTADASGNIPAVNLGWEPQWVLYKRVDSTSAWFLFDTMRGLVTASDPASTANQALYPNLSNAEAASGALFQPTATGFGADTAGANSSWIYIAIRRGPMKTPTSGTSVFDAIARNGTASVATVTTTNLPDAIWSMNRAGTTAFPAFFYDRLRGVNTFLIDNTDVERTATSVTAFNNTSYALGADGSYGGINGITSGYANWVFSRAPGFFDEACFSTAAGSQAATVNHNLGVLPELIIIKRRNAAESWPVWATGLTSTSYYLLLNDTFGQSNNGAPFITSRSTTSFSTDNMLGSNGTYVTHLFASCPGVSKVFSYTGNGTSQTINCGFSAGARFVMVKRTDSTGNWLVVDTARGLVSAGDPTLYLNSTAAEVTGVDWIDPDASGFIVNQESTMNANVNGATYIGLAIA